MEMDELLEPLPAFVFRLHRRSAFGLVSAEAMVAYLGLPEDWAPERLLMPRLLRKEKPHCCNICCKAFKSVLGVQEVVVVPAQNLEVQGSVEGGLNAGVAQQGIAHAAVKVSDRRAIRVHTAIQIFLSMNF